MAAAQDDEVQDEELDAEEPEEAEEAEDADLDSEGERSATADAVHEVIDSTPAEERDRDFGQAVAEAARGSAANDEQPEPARENG